MRSFHWFRRTVWAMSDTHGSTPDGSTNLSEEQKSRTENLGDGSPSGNATEDPRQDSDTASGGEPDTEVEHTNLVEHTTLKETPRPNNAGTDDVDLDDGTDQNGRPVDNPSG
jgi:hypothetical protein